MLFSPLLMAMAVSAENADQATAHSAIARSASGVIQQAPHATSPPDPASSERRVAGYCISADYPPEWYAFSGGVSGQESVVLQNFPEAHGRDGLPRGGIKVDLIASSPPAPHPAPDTDVALVTKLRVSLLNEPQDLPVYRFLVVPQDFAARIEVVNGSVELTATVYATSLDDIAVAAGILPSVQVCGAMPHP